MDFVMEHSDSIISFFAFSNFEEMGFQLWNATASKILSWSVQRTESVNTYNFI